MGNKCKLCERLIISAAVTFDGTNLVVNIPDGTYSNGCKYCIVVAQTIPATATVTAPVYVTIGTGTTLYPLNRCDCMQLTACAVKSRTRYPVKVVTSATGGSFRLLSKQGTCYTPDTLQALPVAPAASEGGGGA